MLIPESDTVEAENMLPCQGSASSQPHNHQSVVLTPRYVRGIHPCGALLSHNEIRSLALWISANPKKNQQFIFSSVLTGTDFHPVLIAMNLHQGSPNLK